MVVLVQMVLQDPAQETMVLVVELVPEEAGQALAPEVDQALAPEVGPVEDQALLK